MKNASEEDTAPRKRVNNTADWPHLYPPPPTESIVLGCPYCIGPIYFEMRDYVDHWNEKHVIKEAT